MNLAVQNDVAPEVGGQIAPVVVLTEDEQRRDFERWTHLNFRVGRASMLMSF